MKENVILEKSFEFAVKIVAVYKRLVEAKEFVLSRQLLRSGTGIGANVNEAQAAQSKKDFTAKMSVASKEARETIYWLRLIAESKLTTTDLSDCLEHAEEIARILTAIVKTSQAPASTSSHTN